MKAFRAAVVFFGVLVGLAAHAASEWTATSPGVARDLWGVCYGSGQFVVVGQNGTILTSPDGRAWTARPSGSTAWLTAVTYADGIYVAVGESGTVLTSIDGAQWVRWETPAHTPRLNAVGFGWGWFIAVGENGSRLLARRGGVWKSVGANGVSRWQRGLTHGRLGFYVTGQDSFVSAALVPDVETYDYRTPRLVETVEAPSVRAKRDFEAVVAGAGLVLAAGHDGAWLRWREGDGMASAILPPTAHTINGLVFDEVAFTAVGDAGVVLSTRDGTQWTVESSGVIENLRAVASSGVTRVAVGDGGRIIAATSTTAIPVIVRGPRDVLEQRGDPVALSVEATGSRPLQYQWFKDGVAIPDSTDRQWILPATDAHGGVYHVVVTNAAGSTSSSSARLSVSAEPLPKGFVDPLFTPAITSGAVRAILPLADGRLMIGGDFALTKPNGAQQYGIARLNTDGSVDPTFDPGLGVAKASGNAEVTHLAQDGAGGVVATGDFDQVNGIAVKNLVRFTAAGTVDPAFRPNISGQITALGSAPSGEIVVASGPSLSWVNASGAVTATVTVYDHSTFYTVAMEVRPDGGVLVAGAYSVSERVIKRVNGDRTVTDIGSVPAARVPAIHGAADGSVLVLGQDFTGQSVPNEQGYLTLYRLRQSAPVEITSVEPRVRDIVAMFAADDRVTLAGNVDGPHGTTTTEVIRLNPDGSRDPRFIPGALDAVPRAVATAPADSVYVGGSFRQIGSVQQPRLARLLPTGTTPNAPEVFVAGPEYRRVRSGETIALTPQVAGSGPFEFWWRSRAEAGPLLIRNARESDAGIYVLTVRGLGGHTISTPVFIDVVPSAAPIVTKSFGKPAVNVGREMRLIVVSEDDTGVTYQWSLDGVPIPGETSNSFYGGPATLATAGTYSVTLTNALGTTTWSQTVQVLDRPVLVNLSARAHVSSGEQTLIAGFVTETQKSVLLRGVGPTLVQYGVSGVLTDPRITLHQADHVIGENDNWTPGAWQNPQLGFALPPGSKDALLYQPVDGAATLVVSDASGADAEGVALAEIYEANSVENSKLLNLSARAYIRGGEGILIAGFSLQGGTGKARVLVRGVAPTLRQFGVQGVLSLPRLVVYGAAGAMLATSVDWRTEGRANEITVAATQVGAIPLAENEKEGALLLELPAGTYTAHLSSADGGAGVGMIEVYDAP